METIIGIEALKDEYRKAKLKTGDLRGLKNRFALSKRLGINQMQTWYYSVSGNGDKRAEVYADVYRDGDSIGWYYSLKDLIESLGGPGEITISIEVAMWNKERTDADRTTVIPEFIFKFK
jgi:hypothetical protein